MTRHGGGDPRGVSERSRRLPDDRAPASGRPSAGSPTPGRRGREAGRERASALRRARAPLRCAAPPAPVRACAPRGPPANPRANPPALPDRRHHRDRPAAAGRTDPRRSPAARRRGSPTCPSCCHPRPRALHATRGRRRISAHAASAGSDAAPHLPCRSCCATGPSAATRPAPGPSTTAVRRAIPARTARAVCARAQASELLGRVVARRAERRRQGIGGEERLNLAARSASSDAVERRRAGRPSACARAAASAGTSPGTSAAIQRSIAGRFREQEPVLASRAFVDPANARGVPRTSRTACSTASSR